MTNLVKSLVCELHQTRPSHVKASGVIPLIPGGEPLGNEIYRSCVTLIQHILGQTGSSAVEQVISPRSKDKLSKEVSLLVSNYRKGTKFRGDKFSRFLKNLYLKNIRGGFIFVFSMKMISDGGRILIFAGLNFHGQKTILEKRENLSPAKFRTLAVCANINE